MKFSSNQFESQLNSIIEKRRKVQKRHFNESNANGQHAQEKLPNVSYNLPLCQEPGKSHEPGCTYASTPMPTMPNHIQHDRVALPSRPKKSKRRPRPALGLCSFCSVLIWFVAPFQAPLLGAAAIYMMMTTGGIYRMYLRIKLIPRLRRHIKDLTNGNKKFVKHIDRLNETLKEMYAEVDDLEHVVNVYQEQNDILQDSLYRYENLTDELSQNNEEYASQNAALNASNAYYEGLNGNLTSSISYTNDAIQTLEEENGEYIILNKQLKNATHKLGTEARRTENLNKDLQNATTELGTEISEIWITNEMLRETATNLNETAQSLVVSVDDLTTQNVYYSALNKNMSRLLSFLDETAMVVDGSFETISDYLDSQIYTHRMLVMKDLRLVMERKVLNWHCMLIDSFADQSWVHDSWELIAPVDPMFQNILNYIDTHVLSELCADAADFELYIQWRYPELIYPDEITLSRLTASVTRYANLIMKFYFLQDEEDAITLDEWAAAGYMCSNLPKSRTFLNF